MTGSTSGIGAAIAETLAGAGAHVLLSGRDVTRAARVLDRIRARGGPADALAVDLTGARDDLRAAAADAVELLGGRPDVLINNAGIYPVTPTRALADTDTDTDEMLAVNAARHVLVGALAPAWSTAARA